MKHPSFYDDEFSKMWEFLFFEGFMGFGEALMVVGMLIQQEYEYRDKS